jgi:alkanesulfonate monooxygenase SsuD/methylene tetrahydromethanopterin reductase-like flavin-dependent oxidoreductase (luciferase family)
MTRPFRFGVVSPVLTDMASWRDRVRLIADLGYSTLMMPDVPGWQPSPAPTLAVAATLTDLRVGTWVYASPFREPWQTAWEAHSLTQLTEGRFELGIGTGRPGIEDQLASYGMPAPSGPVRLAQIRETVTRLRELDGPDTHTPVTMAVLGPRARALATEVADTVTVVMAPGQTRKQAASVAHELRAARDLELALHVSVVGDGVAAFMASAQETDPAALRESDSLAYLPDDPAAAIDLLQSRREELGASYVVIGADFAQTMAPIVAALAGR